MSQANQVRTYDRSASVVFLKTNDPAGPVVSVLVEANVQSAVTVSPAALSLGTVKLDTPNTKKVVVRGTKPFHVIV